MVGFRGGDWRGIHNRWLLEMRNWDSHECTNGMFGGEIGVVFIIGGYWKCVIRVATNARMVCFRGGDWRGIHNWWLLEMRN